MVCFCVSCSPSLTSDDGARTNLSRGKLRKLCMMDGWIEGNKESVAFPPSSLLLSLKADSQKEDEHFEESIIWIQSSVFCVVFSCLLHGRFLSDPSIVIYTAGEASGLWKYH